MKKLNFTIAMYIGYCRTVRTHINMVCVDAVDYELTLYAITAVSYL